MYLMCRTCLDMDSKYFQISDYVDDSHSIIEMLDGIVPQINIIEEENIGGSLAPLICENCLETLITSYKFQQLCIEADGQIRHLIATQSEKHGGIECIPPEEKDNDNMLEHQVVEEFENEKVETKIEIEYDFDRKEADETG